jgi:hypothetical protein
MRTEIAGGLMLLTLGVPAAMADDTVTAPKEATTKVPEYPLRMKVCQTRSEVEAILGLELDERAEDHYGARVEWQGLDMQMSFLFDRGLLQSLQGRIFGDVNMRGKVVRALSDAVGVRPVADGHDQVWATEEGLRVVLSLQSEVLLIRWSVEGMPCTSDFAAAKEPEEPEEEAEEPKERRRGIDPSLLYEDDD